MRWYTSWRRFLWIYGPYLLVAAALSVLVVWLGYELMAVAVHLRGLR